jgi:FKBP-type peptidyl-prolyl cis-trans isomerase FkpA
MRYSRLIVAVVMASVGTLCVACGDGGGGAPAQPAAAAAPARPVGSTFAIPSGIEGVPAIQVEVIQAGTGTPAAAGKSVVMHLVGTVLKTGTKYDSSRDDDIPRDFVAGVGAVQPGWDMVCVLMRAGDRWKATVPSPLMFGKNAGPKVPANSDIVLDLEMVSVE